MMVRGVENSLATVKWSIGGVLLALQLLLLGVGGARGQALSLEACHAMIDSGYPLTRQEGMIRRAAEDHRKSTLMAYVPQLSVGGKATYQSDVTKVDLDLSDLPFKVDINVPVPRKDQYQLYADVTQVVWDGGGNSAKARIVQAESEVGVQQVRVQLERLHSQVDDLYFTLLLIDRRLAVHELLEKELERQLQRVQACVANGVASTTDVGLVEVEQHRAAQGRVELEAAQEAAARALEALIDAPVQGRELEVPTVPDGVQQRGLEYSSPEMDLLHAQVRLADENVRAVNVKLYPTLFLFFRGGWGNPGLNMLEDKFRWYYYAGVQFAWNFGSLYDYQQMRRSSRLRSQSYQIGVESMQRTLRSQGESQRAQLDKYDKILAEDEQIIALRKKIVSTKETQVENGTATVLELLEAVRESQMAEQDKTTHGVERLKSAYKLSRMVAHEARK